MKPKKFYKTKWNFQDRSKDADALVYRHTTLEMIEFAKQYYKQQLNIADVIDTLVCPTCESHNTKRQYFNQECTCKDCRAVWREN